MAEHQKKSEAELNELLTEYWKLRHETGRYLFTRRRLFTDQSLRRGIHGDISQQTQAQSVRRVVHTNPYLFPFFIFVVYHPMLQREPPAYTLLLHVCTTTFAKSPSLSL